MPVKMREIKALFAGEEMAGLIRLSVGYRFACCLLSTLLFLLSWGQPPGMRQLVIAAGIAAANLIGSWFYIQYARGEMPGGAIAMLSIETLAYGVFLMCSGGLLSPYLWYFISTLTIASAFARRRGFVAASVLWYLLCALAARMLWPAAAGASYGQANILIGFLIVAGGFSLLFTSLRRLECSRRSLQTLNGSLREETEKKEAAMRHVIELYDTVTLFGISEPQYVLEALAQLLCRSFSAEGCLLFQKKPLEGARHVCALGIPPEHQAQILSQAAREPPVRRQALQSRTIRVGACSYRLREFAYAPNVSAVLLLPAAEAGAGEEARCGMGEAFYYELMGLVFAKLDTQETAQEYIIGEEQRRIASEIHDTVLQKLFGIACTLHILAAAPETPDWGAARRQLDGLSKSVENTMRELREAIYGLQWNMETQDAFLLRLRSYLEEMERLGGGAITLTVDEEIWQTTAEQKTALYRAVCEAVNNAIRHGKAAHIHASIQVSGSHITACVRDDGIGFAPQPPGGQGQGLKNIYRMMQLLRGEVSIESQRGEGAALLLSIPRQARAQ